MSLMMDKNGKDTEERHTPKGPGPLLLYKSSLSNTHKEKVIESVDSRRQSYKERSRGETMWTRMKDNGRRQEHY